MSKHDDVPTNVYEVGFHVVSSVPEEEVGARVAAVHDVIEKEGGVIISEEFPRLTELAYPMVKVANNQRKTFTSAYFGWVKFESPTSAPEGVKKALDVDDRILRHIILKTVKESTLLPKKLIAQAGKRDDERDERPAKKPEAEKPVMTDEELDKTIDVLAGEAPKPAEAKV